MTPVVLLFVLRLVTAALLLTFVGAIGWFLWRDLRVASDLVAEEQRVFGALVTIAGDDQEGQRYPLYPVTSIGRSQGNTIVLTSNFVSAEHALLTRRGTQWWLEDLGSRNGTLLNQHPLTEATVVSNGDIIGIGETRLKLEL